MDAEMDGKKNSARTNFYWKGKKVSKKVYENRIRLQKVGTNLRKVYGSRSKMAHNLKSADTRKFVELEGRRIVHPKTLGEQLICSNCKNITSLLDVVHEEHFGLASVFHVECRVCKTVNRACTAKQHRVANEKTQAEEIADNTNQTVEHDAEQVQHYDVNTKAVLGILHGGMGKTHLDFVLAGLNIPPMPRSIYKSHEREVGRAIVQVAIESCIKAAMEEKA